MEEYRDKCRGMETNRGHSKKVNTKRAQTDPFLLEFSNAMIPGTFLRMSLF